MGLKTQEVSSLITSDIIKWWAELTRVPPSVIDENNSLFEYGGDSICASQLLGKIEDCYSIEVLAEELFDSSNILSLANLIGAKLLLNKKPDIRY